MQETKGGRWSKFKIILFLFFSFLQLNAQNLTSSPYSRYGMGELQAPGFVQNFSMGGLGISLQNDSATPFNINITNPASFASIKITTFEAGLFSTLVKQIQM